MYRHKKFSQVGKDLTNEIYQGQTFVTQREIKEIVVHCSATEYDREVNAYDIDEWHQQRWGQASGCGYHYIILLDGKL